MLAALAGFNISEKGGTVGLAARCGTDCTSGWADGANLSCHLTASLKPGDTKRSNKISCNEVRLFSKTMS